MKTARNAVLALGILTAFGLLSALGGMALNALPHFQASSGRPGSLALLYILISIPAFVAAFICGAIAAEVFPNQNYVYWSGSTLVLVILFQLASYGRYWRDAEAEDIFGVALATAVLVIVYFVGHFMSRRRAARPSSAG